MRTAEAAESAAPLARAGRAARQAGRALVALAERPRLVLAGLVGAQLVVTVVFAVLVRHNGLVWYQGGDQIFYATTGWLLAHLDLPPTTIGYGWPLVLAPLMLVTGPDYVGALPLILALNVLVLGPLLVAAVYGLATSIGGRLFALWAGALWVAVPPLSILLFDSRYHERLVEITMPQGYGLTAMADFPSMVAVTVAALLVLRSIELDAPWEGALAGLVAGFALGVKPANALFLAGPAVAYLLALRWRPAFTFAAGLAPAALTLLVWKERGLGSVPLFSLSEMRAAAGGGIAVANSWFDQYVPLDWDVLKNNMAQLREYFWSARLAQWVPFAGAVGVARRSVPAAGLLLAWLLAYVVVKGSSPVATIDSSSFFRLVMPAWPAYLLLLAAIALLVPGLTRRLASVRPSRAVGPRPVLMAAVALAAVPLLFAAAARPLNGPDKAVLQPGLASILTPVDSAVEVSVEREGEARRLRWTTPDYGPDVFFRVFRTRLDEPGLTCGDAGASACMLEMLTLTSTRDREYLDGSPPPGVSYRVGVGTNNRDDPSSGDVFVFSPPLRLAG